MKLLFIINLQCANIVKDVVRGNGQKALIFVETKIFADTLGTLLNQDPFNIKSTTLHGDRIQLDRERAINDFKVSFIQLFEIYLQIVILIISLYSNSERTPGSVGCNQLCFSWS